MASHAAMKLGKLPPRVDPRTFKLARYLTPDVPPAPDSIDYTRGKTSWQMLANDTLGDCTIAGVAHAVQMYCLNTWGVVTITDPEVISYYSAWCGYKPGDPSTDQGGVEIDVLNHWRQEGFAKHMLLAYADPDPQNIDHVKQGIALFGCAYIGLALPITAQQQDEWDVVVPAPSDGTADPGSWGGHAVSCIGYDADGIVCVTWGQLKRMTWAFWRAYCDECHILLHRGWYPKGFDYPALFTDLEALAG